MSVKISIRDLNVSVKEKKILKNINLEIKESEKISILGPNGSGKTTLIYGILNAVKISSGEVDNKYLNAKYKIGVSLQEFKLNNLMSVKNTLDLFCEKNSYNDLIETLNLKNQLNSSIRTLSTGEYQKLNYIIAISDNPDLLILDEITTGIDTESRSIINKHLKENINSKTTTLHVSHYLEEANISDRLLFLKEGEIIEDGNKDDLLKKYNLIKQLHIEAENTEEVKSKFKNYNYDIIQNTIILKININNSSQLLQLMHQVDTLTPFIRTYRLIEPNIDDLYNKIYLH